MITVEHRFTPEQRRLLDKIEETRLAAVKPIEIKMLRLSEDMQWTAKGEYELEKYKRGEYGKIFLKDFCVWDWCHEWQKRRYADLWSSLCAMNMRFSTAAGQIYALAPITIRIPVEEFSRFVMPEEKSQ
jgi:hypothetical protein